MKKQTPYNQHYHHCSFWLLLLLLLLKRLGQEQSLYIYIYRNSHYTYIYIYTEVSYANLLFCCVFRLVEDVLTKHDVEEILDGLRRVIRVRPIGRHTFFLYICIYMHRSITYISVQTWIEEILTTIEQQLVLLFLLLLAVLLPLQ